MLRPRWMVTAVRLCQPDHKRWTWLPQDHHRPMPDHSRLLRRQDQRSRVTACQMDPRLLHLKRESARIRLCRACPRHHQRAMLVRRRSIAPPRRYQPTTARCLWLSLPQRGPFRQPSLPRQSQRPSNKSRHIPMDLLRIDAHHA
jgi:hypothetical protein